ncbi:MAG: SufD family Fe-S cluster assembly protein [Patescibacteria group bacterium]|jgi:Fe-S cluster assembly scaffold protein SufB
MIDEREKPLSEVALRSGADIVISVPARSSRKVEVDISQSVSISARVEAGAILSMVLVGEVISDISIVRNVEIVGSGARVELFTACTVAPNVTFRCDDDVHISADGATCIIDDRCVTQDRSNAIIRQRVVVDSLVADGVVETSVRGMLLGDKSRIRVIPELHIASNAIRAKHRVAVARPSKAIIAYFACRGIDSMIARRMVADQFLCPIWGLVAHRSYKTYKTYRTYE